MKNNDVQIGGVYQAKVSDKLVEVRIDGANRHGGWDATNLTTGKTVRIKSAQRLRAGVADRTTESATSTDPEASAPETPAAAPKAKRPRKTNPAGTSASTVSNGTKVSCLDAAARVLAEAGEPLNAKQMIEAITSKGYWTSPGGKTPHATLYSAILREIKTKGTDARFAKAERGKFVHA